MVDSGNKYYNSLFYDDRHVIDSYNSASSVAPIVINLINPRSIVDFGCGVGTWLSIFKKKGVKEVLGLDFNEVDLSHFLISETEFNRQDLRKPIRLKKKYDLAMSIEVAEHIEEKYSDIFVDSITNSSNCILFSAAIPKQGGANHINEQYPQYWVEKFERRGFVALDFIRPKIIFDQSVGWACRQNIILFIKKDSLKKYISKLLPLYDPKKNLIHRTILIQSKPAYIRFSYRINNSIFKGLFNSLFDNLFLKNFFCDIAQIK